MHQEFSVPEGFEALAGFEKWAAPTTNERTRIRAAASKEELISFYDIVLPLMGNILDSCDAFALGKLPPSHQPLYNIALSMAEIAPHVEFYKGNPAVPFSFEEERFIAVHGENETWQALPPNGPR